MSVQTIIHIHKYIGLSTDGKPTEKVPAGSTFYATDTKDKYVWDGSSWVEDLRDSGGTVTGAGLTYKGAWNANTNSPALASGVGTAGDYYIVGANGATNLDGITDWKVGDWAIFSSTNVWQKIDQTVPLTDSTSTTSSVIAASATAVKAAKDAADLKLPLAGGTLSGPLSLGPSYLSTTKTVGATGTTANLLCTIEATTGKVNTSPVSAVGVLGISVTTRAGGSDLTLEVMTRGIGSVVMDTGSTSVVGNLAIVGTTVAGTAKDSGFQDSTSIDNNVQILGKFLSVASPGAAASIQFYGPGHYGAKQILLGVASAPAHYERDQLWQQKGVSVAADRYTLQTPNRMIVNVNNVGYLLAVMANLDLSAAGSWDTTAGTDYTQAANRAGVDFFIYACTPVSGTSPTLLISANSTVPTGYDANTSRKVGGFHCICASVGTIGGHLLTGFVYGDILPASIWDLNWKPRCPNPSGMVFDAKARMWVDIYLTSGTGASTASAYGATISDTRDWNSFVDDGGAIGKKLLRDDQFQLAAANGNEETNIYGSNDPVTAGRCAPILFTGAGLNNLSVNRTAFDITVGAQEYEVEIDGTGTPDTFKWKKRVFAGSYGSSTTTVAITGSAQTLADGITITFATTTGHTLGNKWNIYVMNGFRDTANRRMISDIGCEGMAGVLWQWLLDQSYQCNPDGTVQAGTKTLTAYHVASPDGNPIYLKYGAEGEPYLCCNMAADAVDKILTFGSSYTVQIKHDASAALASYQVYFDEDATQPARILCALPGVKNEFMRTSNPNYWLQITYNAAPGTPGVAINFDDGSDERLEFTSPTSANGTLDLALNSQAWAYYDLPGAKGSLYRQGTYGDVKLLAGAGWDRGSGSGSRARSAAYYRWDAGSGLGGRFASEPG